ncbi:MAG: hypothetical protein AAF266_09530 [Planctomycetota bacterium]
MFPQRKSSRLRTGMVPIEIVLAWPLLIFVLGFVFVTVSVGLSRSSTATEARHHALRARHTPWRADPLDEYEIDNLTVDGMELPARILQPGGSSYVGTPAHESVALHEAVAPVDPIMQVYQSFVSSTEFEASVLSGVWDHREVPFPDHPPLTLTERAISFGFGNIGSFASLGGFGAGFGGHSGDVSPQENQRGSAQQTNTTEIHAAQQLKRQLISQVRSLRSAKKPKWGLIRQLERRIRELTEGIANMRRAQRLIAGSSTP